jgi:RHS repeat-associated protein
MLGNPSYFFYDPVSNRTVLRNALGHGTYFAYDALNRLSKVMDTLGGTTYFEFDAVSNRTKEVDPNNNALQTRFDTLNRVDALRYPDGGSVYFFYDPVSNRTNLLDARQNGTYFGYDQVNRLLRLQDTLGRSTYFEYDAVGNVSRQVGAEGESATPTYDALNRRTNISYAVAGSVVANGLSSAPYYVYDAVGNLTDMGDLFGLHKFAYNVDDRRTIHLFPNQKVIYFEYDPAWNRTAIAYPGTSGKAQAGYDKDERQSLVQAPSGNTCYFVYNAVSNLAQRIYGNNGKLVLTYDNAERVATWRNANKNGGSLSYFDYTRDAKGRITKIFREATYTTYCNYDGNDRLASEVWTTVGTKPKEVYGFRYGYDLAGNRTKALVNGSATYYFYDRANQLTVKGTTSAYASPTYYLYDKNGSLANVVPSSGAATYYAYNPAGLVARILWQDASSTYFFYDGQLQRYAMVANGVLNYFLWDGLDMLQELNSDGTVKDEHTHALTPIAGIGQLLETYRPAQSASLQKIYPVMDPRGSITKWLESDGTTVLASREYDAFGTIIPNSATGTWPNRFGYQGQAWIEIVSANGSQRLLASPARIYDPTDGRFLQNDTIILPGRMEQYLYCGQNPIIRVDENGDEWSDSANAAYEVSKALLDERASLANRIKEASSWWYKSKEVRGYERRVEEINLILNNYTGKYARLPSTDPNACRLQDVEDAKGWAENWADFFAGAGDSLTFGLTGWIRDYFDLGHVDKSSGAYRAGEYTEIAVEILATGGSALLKRLARGASRSAVRGQFARLTAGISRNGGQLHHLNPLFGHPGGAPTLFPLGGLPAWLHSGEWNLKLLTSAEHLAAHLWLRRLENLARSFVNPLTTAGRIVTDVAGDLRSSNLRSDKCGCK